MNKKTIEEFDIKKSQIAIIDLHGTIQYVNAAWQESVKDKSASESASVGDSYLRFFKETHLKNDNQHAYKGVIGVISGKVDEFRCDVECGSQDALATFQLIAKNIQAFDTDCILIEYQKVA